MLWKIVGEIQWNNIQNVHKCLLCLLLRNSLVEAPSHGSGAHKAPSSMCHWKLYLRSAKANSLSLCKILSLDFHLFPSCSQRDHELSLQGFRPTGPHVRRQWTVNRHPLLHLSWITEDSLVVLPPTVFCESLKPKWTKRVKKQKS